jgi:prepilin-type N-terminal cleavage/methylation domain-containing protein
MKIKKPAINKSMSGFTIIELMISTTIFSLVLMICLGGILQITKMYYRSVTQNNTRETARSIADEIGEAIRFSSQSIALGAPVVGPQITVDDTTEDTSYFCIGNKRYTYAIDRQVKPEPKVGLKEKKHALWVDTPEACSAAADLDDENLADGGGRDLVPVNMRLYELSVSSVGTSGDMFEISVGVAYGDDDLLSPRPADSPTELTCEGAFAGVEFCATTNLRVTVQKRL